MSLVTKASSFSPKKKNSSPKKKNSPSKKKTKSPSKAKEDIYVYDTTKNKVLKYSSSKMKNGENLKLIPPTVAKFFSPSKKHFFEKNKKTGRFVKKPVVAEPVKKLSSSSSRVSAAKCKSKGKLYDPEKKVCIDDTPYNQIIVKNKEKKIANNSSFNVRRRSKNALGKRKVSEAEEEENHLSPQNEHNKNTIKQQTCISQSKIPLREHQLKCVIKLLNKDTRGMIASFGVGTGKTLTGVACSECLLDSGTVERVIVASPKSLLNNFKKELIKYHYGQNYTGEVSESIFSSYEFITHSGIKNKLMEMERQPENRVAEQRVENRVAENQTPKKFFLIVDEAHEFRTELDYNKLENKKSSFFLELALLAKKVLLLTATPFVNNKKDLVNLINCVKGGKPYMLTDYPEEKIEKEVFLKDTFMFFELPEFEKLENGMPTSEIIVKKFTMSPKYYNEYMEIEKGFNIDWKNPTVFLSGLRQATNILEGNPKIEWIIDRLVSLKRKTLIYSSYLDSGIRPIQKSLKERKIDYVEITGEMTAEDRFKALKKYNDDEVFIFFITKAGGSGLDLKKTEDVILLESNWNNSNEQQIIGRAIRIGSHIDVKEEKNRHVNVYKLVLAKPVIKMTEEEQENNFSSKKLEKNKLYKGSADEIIQYLNESKQVDENETLKELREYSYE